MIKRAFFQLYTLVLFAIPIAVPAQSPVIVELFTSEGDKNSPPADAVFRVLSAEAQKSGQPVYFLGYHVDYWNKGGWRDPFSKNQFTFRQENYSRVLPNRDLYTPQLVINGQTELLGTDKEKAKAAIEKAMVMPVIVEMTLQKDSVARDTAFISYSCSALDKNYTLRVALTEDGLTSEVMKGENAGKILEHAGVVRVFYSTDKFEKNGRLKIPLKGTKVSERCRFTGFVQHKQTMKVLGAAQAR